MSDPVVVLILASLATLVVVAFWRMILVLLVAILIFVLATGALTIIGLLTGEGP